METNNTTETGSSLTGQILALRDMHRAALWVSHDLLVLLHTEQDEDAVEILERRQWEAHEDAKRIGAYLKAAEDMYVEQNDVRCPVNF